MGPKLTTHLWKATDKPLICMKGMKSQFSYKVPPQIDTRLTYSYAKFLPGREITFSSLVNTHVYLLETKSEHPHYSVFSFLKILKSLENLDHHHYACISDTQVKKMMMYPFSGKVGPFILLLRLRASCEHCDLLSTRP